MTCYDLFAAKEQNGLWEEARLLRTADSQRGMKWICVLGYPGYPVGLGEGDTDTA